MIIWINLRGDEYYMYAAFSWDVSIWSVGLYRNIRHGCGLIKTETIFYLHRERIALIIIPNRDRAHQFMMNFSYMWRIRTYVYVYKRPKSEAPDAIFKSRSNQKFYLDNLINTYFQILMNNEIVTDCFS